MPTTKKEVSEIIDRLKEIQLEQTILINKLERTRRISENKGRGETDQLPRVGDSVLIRSKGRYQGCIGSITKIGQSKATIQVTKGGIVGKTTRVLKNLELVNDRDE